MFKLFFIKKLENLKILYNRLKENINFFYILFPVTITIIVFYVIGQISSLIPWSKISCLRKIDTFCDNLWDGLFNAFLYCIAYMLGFVFNNLGAISLILGLVFFIAIANFINKRKINKRLPIVGIPNRNNVTVLLALFKLRCLEIGNLYYIVQNYQKKADKGNWIELFLKDNFDYYYMNHDWYEYVGYQNKIDVQKQKNKEFISKLLKEKFDFDVWHSDDASVKDLTVALKLWHKTYSAKYLQGISTYGQLLNTISDLKREYNKFNSSSSLLFIHNKPMLGIFKTKIFKSHDTIEEIWEEIIFALKSSLIFLKMQNDNHFNIDEILKEIDALRSLQSKLAIEAVIERKNFLDKRKTFAPSAEIENIIISKIKQNPLQNLY